MRFRLWCFGYGGYKTDPGLYTTVRSDARLFSYSEALDECQQAQNSAAGKITRRIGNPYLVMEPALDEPAKQGPPVEEEEEV